MSEFSRKGDKKMVECQTTLEQLRESNPAHTIAKWTPLLDNIAGRVQVLEHQVGHGNDEKDLRVQGQMEHLQRMLHDALERLHALESIGTSRDARDGMGLPLTPVHVSSSPLAGHEPSMTRLPVPRIPQPTSNVCGMPCGLPDPPPLKY